jgi:hypothetical protein
MPRMPSKEPQAERESRIIAELRPVTCPIIFGVRKVS